MLLSVNARDPDGRDTSWLWDVDYRVLPAARCCVTGERGCDLAVRLEVAGVPFQLRGRLRRGACGRSRPGRLEVIANYTAFQDIAPSRQLTTVVRPRHASTEPDACGWSGSTPTC